MVATITLTVDDKTAEGFQSVISSAKKAETETSRFANTTSMMNRESVKARRALHDAWKEGRTSAQVFRSMADEAMKAAKAERTLASSTASVTGVQSGLNKSTGGFTRGLLEASRGVEDFSSQIGTTGMGGALRAASNNVSQMAFVMGGPLVGAIAGVGVALGATLIPQMFEAKEETSDLTSRLDGLFGAFDRLSSGRAALEKLQIGGVKQDEVAAVQKRIEESKIELDVLRDKGNEIGKQIKAAKALKELQSGGVRHNPDGSLSKRSAEETEVLEQRAKGLSSRIRGMVDEAIAGETDHLEIQRKSNEVLDEFIAKSKEEFQSIEERGHAEVRLQKQRERFVARNRNDGKALREEFRKMDDAEFRRKRDAAIRQSESQEDLTKALEKYRKRQEDIRKELERAADRNKLSIEDREAGLKRIAELKQDEVKVEGRLLKLKEQQERAAERTAQIERDNAQRKRDEAVAEIQKKAQQQFAALQGGLSKSDFGGQVQQIAGGISQGELLRQAAKDRLGDSIGERSGVSRGKESRMIAEEMKKLRMELAKGELDPSVLQNAQSKLINEDLSKSQELGKVGIDNAFKQQQKQQSQSILNGNVDGQQIQQASIHASKSAIDLAQQQGRVTQEQRNALVKQADAMSSLGQELGSQAQQLRELQSFVQGIRDASNRRQSQRRGLGG